tara:strand:- start:912 stop:1661 length:750 start_codon:yes stop_codon:yes gene_type:complete
MEISFLINGFKFYGNSIDRIIAILLWKWSLLEGFESKFVVDKIKSGWTVLDIGANIGFYTIQFSNQVGLNGKVIAVEPAADNLYLLKKNIKVNHLKNVSIIEKAISSKSQNSRLYFAHGHQGDHRIYNTNETREYTPIETITIDDLIKDETRLDLIKMDIQGAEHLAILGIKQTVKKYRNIKIISEFSPKLISDAGGNPYDFLDYFIKEGFHIKYFDEKNKMIIKTTKKDLIKLCTGAKYVSLYLERKK